MALDFSNMTGNMQVIRSMGASWFSLKSFLPFPAQSLTPASLDLYEAPERNTTTMFLVLNLEESFWTENTKLCTLPAVASLNCSADVASADKSGHWLHKLTLTPSKLATVVTAGAAFRVSSVRGGNRRQHNLLPPRGDSMRPSICRVWSLQLPAMKPVSGNLCK